MPTTINVFAKVLALIQFYLLLPDSCGSSAGTGSGLRGFPGPLGGGCGGAMGLLDIT